MINNRPCWNSRDGKNLFLNLYVMDLSSRINLFKEKKRKKEKKKTNKDKTIANNFRDFVEVGILCTPI